MTKLKKHFPYMVKMTNNLKNQNLTLDELYSIFAMGLDITVKSV